MGRSVAFSLHAWRRKTTAGFCISKSLSLSAFNTVNTEVKYITVASPWTWGYRSISSHLSAFTCPDLVIFYWGVSHYQHPDDLQIHLNGSVGASICDTRNKIIADNVEARGMANLLVDNFLLRENWKCTGRLGWRGRVEKYNLDFHISAGIQASAK